MCGFINAAWKIGGLDEKVCPKAIIISEKMHRSFSDSIACLSLKRLCICRLNMMIQMYEIEWMHDSCFQWNGTTAPMLSQKIHNILTHMLDMAETNWQLFSSKNGSDRFEQRGRKTQKETHANTERERERELQRVRNSTGRATEKQKKREREREWEKSKIILELFYEASLYYVWIWFFRRLLLLLLARLWIPN